MAFTLAWALWCAAVTLMAKKPYGSHAYGSVFLQGMEILIPAFLTVAFAYNQTLFYIGLLLFSFG